MGHNLTGLIGPKHALAEFAAKRALHEPVELAQNLYLLPLRDEDIDSFMPPLNDGQAPGFLYLSRQLRDELAAASKGAAFAYVETFYHGGEGTQGAVVFQDEQIVFGPSSSEVGPINEALRLLGATASPPAIDEFEAVGLGHRRHTADWLELPD